MSCEICVNHVPLRKARPFLSPQGATFGSAEHAKRRDEAPRRSDGYYERQVVARL